MEPVNEPDLHAYADDALPKLRRTEVEAWLAAHPDDAARVATWRTQSAMIRAQFHRIADEPVPARFDLTRLADTRSSPWKTLAAALALLILGVSAGWFGRTLWDGTPATKVVVAEALGAHRLYIAEMRHPIEVPADAAHLIPWLSRRVGHEIRAPDLAAFGLKLIGGRLLPGPKSPAALFMYESASGERFTLYAARSTAPESALRYRVDGAIAAYYWVEKEISYVVSGPADQQRLHRVAESAYEQMERAPARDRSSEQKSSLLIQ